MLNIHNPRQCFITFNWSRYLSLYQLAYGSRELGFRDSSQDVMGSWTARPTGERAFWSNCCRSRKKNGSALHQFNPLTMVGNEGDSLERADLPIITPTTICGPCWQYALTLRKPGILDFWKKTSRFMKKN